MRPSPGAWCSAALVVALVLVLSLAVALGTGTSAAVAGCEARSATDLRAATDATAIGTIVAMERGRLPLDLGTPQNRTYWFEITEVYHGAVQEVIEVKSSHGYDFDLPAEGRSYLLFLAGESPSFYADGCSSMPMPLTAPEVAAEVAQWDSVAPGPGGAEVPRGGPPWLAIGLGTLVLAMVLVLVRDRRRRTRPAAS